MNRYYQFVGIGSLFATVEEFLTIVVLKNDVSSYLFTLLVLFPVYLTLVYLCNRFFDRLNHGRLRRELMLYFIGGTAGLMIEWFLIGLSPWSNPKANPFLMAGFQLGMFSFWATVSYAPRFFLNENQFAWQSKASLLRFYIAYFGAAYMLALILPREKRFGPVIVVIIVGYVAVNVWFVRFFKKLHSNPED